MKKNHLLTIFGLVLTAGLMYTRFTHLSWGLPFPFHPDERNMAVAIEQFTCTSFPTDCFNPHFFAYGQLPLYIGYIVVKIYQFLNGGLGSISFEQAVLALRLIAASASVATAILLFKIAETILASWKVTQHRFLLYSAAALFVFSPALIQFAHFGTTESLLMMLYTAIVYRCLLLIQKKVPIHRAIIYLSVLLGLSIGTKVSSLVFVLPALYALWQSERSNGVSVIQLFFMAVYMMFGSLVVSFISSPYNLIAFNDFLSSIRYESTVGLGQTKVFYTQQFEDTVPALFQAVRIVPYALGLPAALLSLVGFLFLPWKKEIDILRLSIGAYLILNAELYAKWTRFMAPILPLLVCLAVLLLIRLFILYEKKATLVSRVLFTGVLIIALVPGIAYMSVYHNDDVRFTATQWMVQNIPKGARVLQESGNVVDLPLSSGNFQTLSFNFYEVDHDPDLKAELPFDLRDADYIIVPSRRVFANYTCTYPNKRSQTNILGYSLDHCQKLESAYPVLNQYYRDLFSGASGFQEIAQISSYPTVQLFGTKLWMIQDEQAEETWSVFDHPVIRVYKKIPSNAEGI